MDRKTTPQIEQMEATMEQGRSDYRAGVEACPFGKLTYQYGWWKLGWHQARIESEKEAT